MNYFLCTHKGHLLCNSTFDKCSEHLDLIHFEARSPFNFVHGVKCKYCTNL